MTCRRAALLVLLVPALADADRPDGVCLNVDVDVTPTDNLQIVGWLEKPDGTFVDTIFITNKIGRYGMGNRPGRSDFNTGSPLHDTFPYGRREQTFPVWAHRHGKTWPKIVSKDETETTISHPFQDSSAEKNPPYSRPCLPGSEATCDFDAGTSSSFVFSDKGKFDPHGATSLYPPRTDLTRVPTLDTPDVDQYRALNPFDSVSHATPEGGVGTVLAYSAPQFVDPGDYVLFIETSKTYDFNGSYNDTIYPTPKDLQYNVYGKPWRGQPSVVYKVPITLASTPTKALADTYVGYGDPTGQTGTLNPPDATITTDTPGSGASRLQLVSDGPDMFRVRVRAAEELDPVAPGDIGTIDVTEITGTTATLELTAPGDDDRTGKVFGYDVRIRSDVPIDDTNFADSVAATTSMTISAAGAPQSIALSNLLPETTYYIGIRAYDNCFNRSKLMTFKLTTSDRKASEVGWCFVATAAYGSSMATEVGMLRRFRDGVLERSVLGELAVETYYTFGPAVANVVDLSELLRATARTVLEPIVAIVGRYVYR